MNGDEKGEKLEIEDRFLVGSSFTRVSLKDARISESHMMGAVLDDVNAAGMGFENVNLSGARFHDVNLSGVRIEYANLSGLAIADVILDGMTIDGHLVSDLLKLAEKKSG